MNTQSILLLLGLVLALVGQIAANSQCTQVCTYGANYEYACVCCTDSPGNTAQTPDPNIDYNTCMDQCNNYYCPGYSGYKKQANSTSSGAQQSKLEVDVDSVIDAAQKNFVRQSQASSASSPSVTVGSAETTTVVPVNPAASWSRVAQVFGANTEASLKAQFPNGCAQSCGASFAVDQQEVRCLCPLNEASQAPSFNHFSFVKGSDGTFQCNNPDLLKVSNPASIRQQNTDNGQAQCEALGCACGFIIPRKLAVFRRWKDLSQERRNAVINRAWNIRERLQAVKLQLSQTGLAAETYRDLRQQAQSLLSQLRSNNF